jgi:uncharacterized protein (DUF2141 family)
MHPCFLTVSAGQNFLEQKLAGNLPLAMKTNKSTSIVFILGTVAAFLAAAAPFASASTIWNGPTISFTHTDENGLQDQLTPGVALTRDSSGGGLYNAVTESGAVSGTSPDDTEWAIGSLDDYNTLTYGSCPLEAGNHPPGYIGTTFVVHLINEDIYLSLTLTDWEGQGGSGDKIFSYDRSTPAVAPPPTPTVNITIPASGTLFAAPANVNFAANASVSSGTVTNLQFFTNGISFNSVLSAPFSVTASNLAAGAYALTAVATAAGISATSTVVNITVDAPPTVNITNLLNNATFSAPANVTIRASASDSDGTVTNVQFLVGANVLTNVSTAPFSGTTNNLAAGNYTISAIASDNNGVKNTNSISIKVVTPVVVTLGNPALSSSTNFQFSYPASIGLSYVIQRSASLAPANWIPLVTNVAASNPVVFLDVHATNSPNYYRVGRLPNP